MTMYHLAGTMTVRAAVAAWLFSALTVPSGLQAADPPLKPVPVEEAFLLPIPATTADKIVALTPPAKSVVEPAAGVAKVASASTASPVDIQKQIAENVNRMQTFDQKSALPPSVSDEDIERVFKDFRITHPATSDAQSRQQAIRSMPLRQMQQADQVRCQQVLSNISLYRHMPTITFEVHPQAYQYFVSHPDVAVAIWRNLGVTKMNLYQTGPHAYECDDKAGTLSIVDYLYRGNDLQIVYCDGDFASPFLNKPIHASGIFALKTEFKPQADGRFFVTHTADVFLSFPSTAIETAAKLISPLSNIIADRNFREVSLFVHTMSKAMQKQPSWIEDLSTKLDGVMPERRPELVKLTAIVYTDERKRKQSLTAGVE